MKRLLSVFDFDNTIVSQNSDCVLRNLLPRCIKFSPSVAKLYQERQSWTTYMAEIFKLLADNGIDKMKIQLACKRLSHTDGMAELLSYLSNVNSDLLILSDANSEIISSWLTHNHPNYKIDIITNPALWNNGVLEIMPYEDQTTCPLCPKNMCKGSILLKYLEGKEYNTVIYTGDGKNDFCPSKKLRSTDYVFPREGSSLDNLLKESKIDANVYSWKSARKIKEILEKELNLQPEANNEEV